MKTYQEIISSLRENLEKISNDISDLEQQIEMLMQSSQSKNEETSTDIMREKDVISDGCYELIS